MKIATLFTIVIALQLSLMLFSMGHHSDTAIFGFVNNPTNWSNTTLILVAGGIAAGMTLVAFVGSFLFGKTDTMIFASMSFALITCAIPLTSLWQLIYEEKDLFGGNPIASAFVATLISAPLLIIGFFTIINWWRSNSEM